MSGAQITTIKDEELVSRRRFGPAMMEDLARRIQETLPPGVAFALVAFNIGDGGHAGYISNAERGDMIMALRESADRLEATADAPAGGPSVSNH